MVDGAVARLEIVGDLGAGARRTGLNAAFGRRDEAVAGASVRAVRQAFEVCVVSGGRGLLEAASPAVVPFDLDVPFRQDAEETQRVDQSAAAGGDAACLVGCVSYGSSISISTKPHVGVPLGADPAVTGTVEARVEADVES